MAHNLNYNKESREYSFYSLKERPWHGLGQIVEEAKTSKEVIQLAHLDYEVGLAKLYAAIEKGVTNTETLHFENAIRIGKVDPNNLPKDKAIFHEAKELPGEYATYRTDTGVLFGRVGSRYNVIQNIDCFDFFDNVIGKENITFQTAGALGKGERIFITAKLNENFEISNGDVMEDYLLLTSGHTGNDPIRVMFTKVRVVCNNTLNMALRNCKNNFTVKHTLNAKDKLEQATTLLKIHKKYSHEFMETIQALSKMKVPNDNVIDKYVCQVVLSSTELQKLVDNNFNIQTCGIKSSSKDTVSKVSSYIQNGVGQDKYVGTALWLYNGVTSYINNGIKYDTQEEKLDSITEGDSFDLQQKALALALDIEHVY